MSDPGFAVGGVGISIQVRKLALLKDIFAGVDMMIEVGGAVKRMKKEEREKDKEY